jgi:hypothetical protein
MGWIITTRNPRTKKLVIITDGNDPDDFAEFHTEGDAAACAIAVPLCAAWGYETVEVPDSVPSQQSTSGEN